MLIGDNSTMTTSYCCKFGQQTLKPKFGYLCKRSNIFWTIGFAINLTSHSGIIIKICASRCAICWGFSKFWLAPGHSKLHCWLSKIENKGFTYDLEDSPVLLWPCWDAKIQSRPTKCLEGSSSILEEDIHIYIGSHLCSCKFVFVYFFTFMQYSTLLFPLIATVFGD